MTHIWLVGMMGTGKTTVGAIVAETAGRPFIDVDTRIMERSGHTIPKLFSEGESVFRRWETSIITEIGPEPASVISTGGGAVLAAVNVEHMRATGRVVLLTASIETITDRIGGDPDRPLAPDPAALATLAELRREIYIAVSDVVVATDHREAVDIAEEVVRCVPMS